MKAITGILVLLAALLWQWLSRQPPPPTDPQVAKVSAQFQAALLTTNNDDHTTLKIHKRGVLNWSLDTFVWSLFGGKFGSNPNTPYMYNILPLGGLLPSPMWRLQPHDAVVLLFKRPPKVEYFSFTTFCLGSWKRGLVFASLGDSLNSHSPVMTQTNHSLFAHVVVTESSNATLTEIQDKLVASGIDKGAIHVAVIPNKLAKEDTVPFYEVVLRLFRFQNQTDGDIYLKSKHPVFYIQGKAPKEEQPLLPKATYKDRSHPDSVDEPSLFQNDLTNYQDNLFSQLNQSLEASSIHLIPFNPLYILGLNCVENIGHQCLGDCPDAAYFGSNIHPNHERIESLSLRNDNEFHLISMVDHRQTNASIYSSIALLKTHKAVLNKHKLEVRGTSIGVITNHELQEKQASTTVSSSPFFSWIFTRNPEHCEQTRQLQLVQGCTVLDEKELPRDSYFAYCERLYLNPVTGTGPDWKNIVPAQLHHFQGVKLRPREDFKKKNAELFARLRLPSSNVKLAVFDGEKPLKFLHIVKTGGESLEGYLKASYFGASPTIFPPIDYATCIRASATNLTASWASVPTSSCWTMSTFVSTILCGLNCECCAGDLLQSGGFHGTLIRSPRSHTLSLFSHGHNAHHTTWKRIAADVTLYLAEGALRATEQVCGHSGTNGVADWKVALQDNLESSLASWPPRADEAEGVQVISLRNTQSHVLTCGKKTSGGLGQHFRLLSNMDALEPNLEKALETLHRLEWVGITDLYHPSLCLLHYQANQTLSERDCDCRHPQHHTNDKSTRPLGHWVEYRTKKRSIDDLSPKVIDMVDAHTTVDTEVFAAALRLVLGRLRRLEELTGASILECIDWYKLQKKSDYIPGLWSGGPDSLLL